MHPLVKASLTSATLFAAGDFSSQRFIEKNAVIDTTRMRNFSLLGAFLHAPFFSVTMPKLSATLMKYHFVKTASPLVRGAVMGIVSQFTLFPTYLFTFLLDLSIINGEHPLSRVESSFAKLWTTGCAFWPLANIVTFGFCPPAYSILWVNVCALFWNTFLSYCNRRAPEGAAIDHEHCARPIVAIA